MSVETDLVPPVPEHTPPLREDEGTPQGGRYFNQAWTRWFVSVRAKINVLNESLVNLAGLTGSPGFLVQNGAQWVSRIIQGTANRVSVSNGNGVGGDPTINVVTANLVAGTNVTFTGSGVGRIIDNGGGNLTINAAGGGGGGPAVEHVQISDMLTNLTTGDLGGWTSPGAIQLDELWVSLRESVSSSGNVTVGASVGGSSILGAPMTILVGARNSLATPTVITNPVLAQGAILRFDVPTSGTNAKGLEAVFSYSPYTGGDPFYSDVVLLINGVGTNGSTAFYDAKGRTITTSGTVTIVTTDPDFPDGALRITGGSYLFIADSSDFDFIGDFTIEFDYKAITKPTSIATPLSMYNSYGANGGMTFFDRHTGSPSNFAAAMNGSFPVLSFPAPGNGVKAVFRYVRTGTTLSLYVNDVFISSTTQAGTRNAVGGIWIGTAGDGVGSYYIDGFVGRIRMTKAARSAPQGTLPYPEI